MRRCLTYAHACSRMQIRVEFEKLVETNAALPPAEQLTHEEFEVDPELRLLLEKEAADKVEEARKELQVSASLSLSLSLSFSLSPSLRLSVCRCLCLCVCVCVNAVSLSVLVSPLSPFFLSAFVL